MAYFTNLRTLYLLWLSVFLLLLAISAEHILTPVTPNWDIAADMLLQNKIEENGYLLTGHYSRWEFNHPGPFWFYYNYAVEHVLSFIDISRVQTWYWGSLFINSLLLTYIAISLTVLFKRKPSFILGFSSVILIVGFVGEDVTGIWMPDRLIIPYAAFLVSLALLSKGYLKLLPASVFLTCILVHGYITMPLFTIPFLSISLFFSFNKKDGVLNTIRLNVYPIIFSIFIISIFITPLIIDYLLNKPSNLTKIILANSSFKELEKPSISDCFQFLKRLFIDNRTWPWMIIVLVFSISTINAIRLRINCYPLKFITFLLTIDILVFLYYSQTPAPLSPFIAKFCLSTPGLAISALVLSWSYRSSHNFCLSDKIFSIICSIMIISILVPIIRPQPIKTGDDIKNAALYLSQNSDQDIIVIDYSDHYLWLYIAGILAELTQNGIASCTKWSHMSFLYTENRICNAGAVPQYKIVLPDECKNNCKLKSSAFAIIDFHLAPIERNEVINHISDKVFWGGWQSPEKDFRWTKGKQSQIVFKPSKDDYKGTIVIKSDSLGEQRLMLDLNGFSIFDGVIKPDNKSITVSFDPGFLHVEKVNKLSFLTPDAHTPGGSDNRELAIALHTFKLD